MTAATPWGLPDPGEYGRARDDEDHHADRLACVVQHRRVVREPDLPIDEEVDDKDVDDCDGGGFRRREDAGVDSAEDDDGRQQAPDRILERAQE